MLILKTIMSSWRRPLILTLLVLAPLCTVVVWNLSADDLPDEPSRNDRQVVQTVRILMRRDHLAKHPLDDEISERALKNYLKSLDPLKVYFYKSDIDEFAKHAKSIDDDINRNDIMFGYVVFKRFLQRVDERAATIAELLEQDFDFNKDEVIITDGDVAKYPTSPAEAKDRWRKRIKYDLLSLETEGTKGKEARDKLGRRYRSFARRMHQTDGDELLEMYLTAITMAYDPHTTYMSAASLEDFRILMRLNLDGIGASLKLEDGYTIVNEVIPGGAADKHGKLKPQDRIVSVGQGNEGEMVDVVDRKLRDVVKLIRGRAGSTVRLGVVPGAGGELRTYKIVRARIELKDSEARGEIRKVGKRPDGKPYRLGIINLPSFYMDMEAARRGLRNYKSTTRDVRRIIEGFKEQGGVDTIVLDLRRNGGGSLTEAINLTGLFIDTGPVVQVKDPDGNVEGYDDNSRGMAWEGPLVVLTSKFSASASEILAGAIKDYNRGLIVGDRSTHGKGTVQSLLDLGGQLFPGLDEKPNLGALKITMQQFYRPNGASTQKRGVLAHVVLPAMSDHMPFGEADLDFAVEFDRVKAADFTNHKLVSPAIVQPLQQQSANRVRKSEDFTKLQKRIEKYKQQKERKSVNLNREKFLADRKEFDADKEDEEQLNDQDAKKREVFADTYYNSELLNVTVDYLDQLRRRQLVRN